MLTRRSLFCRLPFAFLLLSCVPSETRGPNTSVAVPSTASTGEAAAEVAEDSVDTIATKERCAALLEQLKNGVNHAPDKDVDDVWKSIEPDGACKDRESTLIELGRTYREAVVVIGLLARDASSAYVQDAPPPFGMSRERAPGFCPSTEFVPDDLAKLAPTYQSTPEDWSAEPWKCMKFKLERPQYVQVRVERMQDGQGFVAMARRQVGNAIVTYNVEARIRPGSDGRSIEAPELLESFTRVSD